MGTESVRASTFSLILLLLLAASSSVFSTYLPLPAGYKVVNNDALNNRVKNGDIIRYVILEETSDFALTFFNAGPPSSTVPPGSEFYLSIVTKPSGDPSLWNVIWSANRGNPVHEDATLALDGTGNLVLTDANGTQVWSTGSTWLATTAVSLDISGNLQLLNSTNGTIWQSFDSPTDSLLPGQWLKTGKSLVSAKSTRTAQNPNGGIDYSSGSYSLDALPGGLALFSNGTNSTTSTTPYYIQSAESQLHDLNSVLHTCEHPNDVYFDSTLGLVIYTDVTQTSPAADASLCGHGDSSNATVVISMMPTMSMEGGSTQRFVRVDPDGSVDLYQYDIPSRAFLIVGNLTASPAS